MIARYKSVAVLKSTVTNRALKLNCFGGSMAKVIHKLIEALQLDCNHLFQGENEDYDDEVDCPVCADNEKRVTAARMEMLQEVRKRLRGAITTANGMRVFDISIDKLIAELEATR